MPGGWILQLPVLLMILTIFAFFLGEYMAKVFEGKHNILSPILAPIEKGLYKLFGVNPTSEMNWKSYAFNVLIFNLIGFIFIFLLQELQGFLPFNPQKFGAVRWDTAINAAVSYITNTNWQSYTSTVTMSYLTQMLGMGLQNFLSAATGISVAIALIQGFARKTAFQIGNFWVNLTRSIIYILLPLAIIVSLVLVSQGIVQNFNPYTKVHTLQNQEQTIPQGPAASQIAIKHIGTSGGGFFSANSAYPYENPTPMSDYLEIFSMLLIAAAFPFAFGAMINNRKQGYAIFTTMMLLYILGISLAIWAEFHGNPLLEQLGVHHGINMEGKEMRFGPLSSVVFAHAATATSTGAVNAAADSFMPLTSLILIFNMVIGEVIFGGVGSGLVNMILYAILTMFLIGLMIGRSPEIYGKKLESYEMTMIVIALIIPPVIQLIFSAIACTSASGLASLSDSSSHGLSEIIYTFASGVENNGSALNGINVNTHFYNITTALAMFLGRFLSLITTLAIAGSLAQKKLTPITSRFPTASPLFIVILCLIVFIVGALTFLPVLVIGPFLEHMTILTESI